MVQQRVVERGEEPLWLEAEMGKGYQTGLQRCPGADQEGPNQPRRGVWVLSSVQLNSVKSFRKQSGGIQFKF